METGAKTGATIDIIGKKIGATIGEVRSAAAAKDGRTKSMINAGRTAGSVHSSFNGDFGAISP